MLYDNVLITLIFVVDSCSLFLAWKAQTRRERQQIARKANRLLGRLGIR